MFNRPLIIGVIGVVLLAIGGLSGWLALRHAEREDHPSPANPPTATAPTQSAPSAATQVVPPSFDVVRINPSGDAVMAGRAAPNATVHLFDGDHEIGKVTADARGEWVFVPPGPLPPGSRELSLSEHVGDQDIRSDQVVVLAVPERGRDLAGQPTNGATQPLVVSTSRSGQGPSRILQGPGAGGAQLSLDLASIDNNGAVMLSGHAPPNATLQIYLNNKLLGRTTADAQGHWTLAPQEHVDVGSYTLRLDELKGDGKVATRIELPFVRGAAVAEDAASGEPGGSQVTVKKGDSLWRIARHISGRGMAYLVIYEANRDQIRDPNLIYPGQVFHVTRLN